jgi:phosphoglycerol transferase MdoB-like AlkP superfamily enzyme
LYWEFNLSSSGRTFAAIPTLTGSLPFGKNGFLEINETPHHFNLFNILKKNGFETGFFYGGNSSFDRMKEYLQYSEVNNIIDQYSFSNHIKNCLLMMAKVGVTKTKQFLIKCWKFKNLKGSRILI